MSIAHARYLVAPLCVAFVIAACEAHRPFDDSDGSSPGDADGNSITGGAGSIGLGGKAGGIGGMTGGTGGMSTGSGGASGGGGMIGAGGTPGAGGAIGTGGKADGGMSNGAGGMISSAGGSGVGGKTGAGGMTSVGGAPGAGGMTSMGGAPGAGGTIVVMGPCDVLAAGGNSCVAAHSTVRLLKGSYTGPLYQVCKGTAGVGPNSCAVGTTLDIGTVPGGYADFASQDTFCAGASCTISIIYDQSLNGNHLKPAPASGNRTSPDNPASATDLKITLNGHPSYGVAIKANIGYRAGCTGCGVPIAKSTATGDQPETEYMVTSQNGIINGCCFDYGNAETDSHGEAAR